jgi:hypothetical protein
MGDGKGIDRARRWRGPALSERGQSLPYGPSRGMGCDGEAYGEGIASGLR